jgi:hypothetical protein
VRLSLTQACSDTQLLAIPYVAHRLIRPPPRSASNWAGKRWAWYVDPAEPTKPLGFWIVLQDRVAPQQYSAIERPSVSFDAAECAAAVVVVVVVVVLVVVVVNAGYHDLPDRY